jgi:hypothetical protein
VSFRDTLITELAQHINQNVEVATTNNLFGGVLLSVNDRVVSIGKTQHDTQSPSKTTWIPISAISFVRLLDFHMKSE